MTYKIPADREWKIGEAVSKSPIGPGKVTGLTQAGFPQVNNVAVTWLVLEDGAVVGHKPANEINISPRLAIRLNNDKTVDEIITRDETGECLFHMEQMSKDPNTYWMRFYSTPAVPLPRELIVNFGPGGAVFNFDPPSDYEDEEFIHEEFRTPPESIPQQIDHFMRYFGMKLTLEAMIKNVSNAKRDEQMNWPDRDTSYLDKLVEDLTTTLKNYEARYQGKPDYEEGEATPAWGK